MGFDALWAPAGAPLAAGESSVTALVATLVLQLGVILIGAKLGGELAERVRQPPVLGELVVGVALGPYLLGGLALPLLGRPLFPLTPAAAGIPVSTELYAFAQVASVLLLFLVGLETDLGQFLRFGPSASLIGLGGIVLPVLAGVVAALFFGQASSPLDGSALFIGAVMAATSVGITARVLADLRRLDSAEGVTILAAAVVDDVLGILVLAIALGIGARGEVSLPEVGLIGVRAIGFWLLLTAAAILLARPISRLFLGFRTEGAGVALALGLAFLGAYLAESFGLALIIGAYSIGLGLSTTPLGKRIEPALRGVYQALVPVFFVVMGMLVDLPAMSAALAFGLAITLLAVVTKLLGTALPARLVGFTWWGAIRIGIGMVPRGEVALIIAGVGLTSGIIGTEIFGVAVMMTVVTTLLAPVLLVPAFQRGGPGRVAAPAPAQPPAPAPGAAPAGRRVVNLDAAAATLFVRYLRRSLERAGFRPVFDLHDPSGPDVAEFRSDGEYLTLVQHPEADGRVELELEYEAPRFEALVATAVRAATEELATEILGSLERQPGETRRA